MTRIVNLDSKGFMYRERSSEVVEVGDAIILIMKPRQLSLQVTVTGSSYYMVSVTQSESQKVKDGNAVFIDGEDADFSATEDFIVEAGGAVKIENKSYSTDSIEVDWRV
jgi:hypothetical protein